MLCVDRGVSCECHTQVVSYHTTNTPGEEAVRRAVEKNKELLNARINAFIDFMLTHDSEWEFKDLIGVQFKWNLLRAIARAALEEE